MNEITIEGGEAIVAGAESESRLPIRTLPEPFADWIERGRREMYAQIRDGAEELRFFSGHLPVVVTRSADSSFPFNCANKGVGFLPRERHLPEFIDLFEHTIEATRDRPWRESLRERVEAVSRFYFARDKIDLRALTTLEIFAKTTYRNLLAHPFASLLFTGDGPDYTSFQLNCVVEVIDPDDPRHTFIRLARTMFEYDDFHIAQSAFPHAYVFWISEVVDKTPFRVHHDARPCRTGAVPWSDDARGALARIPGRVRAIVEETVERYARERGFSKITDTVLREAKTNFFSGNGRKG